MGLVHVELLINLINVDDGDVPNTKLLKQNKLLTKNVIVVEYIYIFVKVGRPSEGVSVLGLSRKEHLGHAPPRKRKR